MKKSNEKNKTSKKADVILVIQKIVAHQLKKKPDQIMLQSRLKEDLGAESLDALEIIMSIEEAFDIQISEVEARKAIFIQDIVNFVETELKKGELLG